MCHIYKCEAVLLRLADTLLLALLLSPVAKKHSIDQPIRTESTESVTDFSFFSQNPRPGGKENILIKTGLIGDQNKWMVSFFNHNYTV